MKTISHSLAETEACARAFIETLDAREDAATVVGLYGDLGAGKTAFSKGVATVLNITETITSPTFVIMKMYQVPQTGVSKFKHFIHIDAYRLEGEREMQQLGWDEIIATPGNLVLIEWPEKVSGIMPEDHIRINFTGVDEETREIEVVE